MAGWISSKLKVAETFLQQIDQQAAESLGKSENLLIDSSGNESQPKVEPSVSLKDQLKQKTSEVNDRHSYSYDHVSEKQRKLIESSVKNTSIPSSSVVDSDWTELLGPSKPSSALLTRPNGKSPIRSLKRQGIGVQNSSSTEVRKNNKRLNDIPRVTTSRNTTPETKTSETDASLSTASREIAPSVSPLLPPTKKSELQTEISIEKIEKINSKLETEQELKIKSIVIEELNTEKAEVIDEKLEVVFDHFQQEKNETVHEKSLEQTNHKAIELNRGDIGYVKSTNPLRKDHSGTDEESDSETDSDYSSDSESENRRKEELRKRREQILAEKAYARALAAIKEREDIVARLEGEKQGLERILDERKKQQAKEASELQTSMIEAMQAAEVEKQKHNSTRMEAMASLTKLETMNGELAKSLANAQWNLEVEVNRVADLRRKIDMKEVLHEELKRKITKINQSALLNELEAARGVQFQRELLEAEYTCICDKIVQLQGKTKNLEENIELTRKEVENPTVVEVELKKRLAQLTDHLIQKQTQVESLSSEKASLQLRLETSSRMLEEEKSQKQLAEASFSSRDIESGTWYPSYNSRFKPALQNQIRSGKKHFGSILLQLDSIFSAGSVFLRRNPAAKIYSLLYLICLHLWVLYIFASYSSPSVSTVSTATMSIKLTNNNSSG